MNNKVSQNILTGRPFGGVAILWEKKLSELLTISCKGSHVRRFLSVLIIMVTL